MLRQVKVKKKRVWDSLSQPLFLADEDKFGLLDPHLPPFPFDYLQKKEKGEKQIRIFFSRWKLFFAGMMRQCLSLPPLLSSSINYIGPFFWRWDGGMGEGGDGSVVITE